MPYLGHLSFKVRNQLQSILKQSFPQIKFIFVFTSNHTLGSFLKKKDPLPMDICSNIVYLFTCPGCNTRYVGSTSRWFKHRIFEHMGKSVRTGLPLSNPSFSAIREHAHTNDHTYTSRDFKVLTTSSNRLDLIILELLYIHRMAPELSNQTTAIPLFTI